MSERTKKAVEMAVRRRRGADPQHAGAVRAELLSADDLRSTCRKCGKTLKGTIEDIRAHVCAPDEGKHEA